jgi:23S rRNA (adenine2503-C2)-methyltransferase
MKIHQLPTGYLFIDSYSKGELETLSIGDYGKGHNVKANFLGYDRQINGVENTHCMPLSEKWVVTLSTQYGCIQKCKFCSVPNVKFRGNVSFDDLKDQLYNAIKLFPNVKYTERLNIHFARMGEPIFNNAVFEFAKWLAKSKKQIKDETGLRIEVIHPVLTTSLPESMSDIKLQTMLERWTTIKNEYFNGQAGLQLSINSTNDVQRNDMFGGSSKSLEQISEIVKSLPEPLSRKYCLNFALASGYEVDAPKLRKLFDPEYWMVKITPIHNNNECKANGIETIGGYDSFLPYQKAETDLIAVGFDVLIFVPSMDEERGIVTCGNAILGGSEITVPDNTIKIFGV